MDKIAIKNIISKRLEMVKKSFDARTIDFLIASILKTKHQFIEQIGGGQAQATLKINGVDVFVCKISRMSATTGSEISDPVIVNILAMQSPELTLETGGQNTMSQINDLNKLSHLFGLIVVRLIMKANPKIKEFKKLFFKVVGKTDIKLMQGFDLKLEDGNNKVYSVTNLAVQTNTLAKKLDQLKLVAPAQAA